MPALWSFSQGFKFELALQIYDFMVYPANKNVKKTRLYLFDM